MEKVNKSYDNGEEKYIPEYGKIYYFVDFTGINKTYYTGDNRDKKRISVENCFQSEKTARKYFDRINELFKKYNYDKTGI